MINRSAGRSGLFPISFKISFLIERGLQQRFVEVEPTPLIFQAAPILLVVLNVPVVLMDLLVQSNFVSLILLPVLMYLDVLITVYWVPQTIFVMKSLLVYEGIFIKPSF